ncbi:serine/threonine-protein phosphatase 6 regulatory ankyrin repeat subunit A-like [Haliotis rubra]|uniref:serine/threonine-protein phosphatase 6 regulatory ankyrin repeat subunit A-like n=1 Tax=Haliotis rubra TaxID=36100 RepID=UPI001EE54E05|nr:serine/threonine-protein phosphatase 6 regulatory ankyrin repeat subunit A-like [Haliotis rubra]
MWAAGMGHRDVVELLVTKGAKLSLVDNLGVNILQAACLGGDVEVVKYVLSQDRVDINGRVRCGRTPVMLAAENGHFEVMELLVGKGANLSLVDKRGNNILHCACRRGDVEVVKYIVSKKMVDINSRERKNKTPLMVAGVWGHEAVVGLLVKQGANQALRDKRGNNILHLACQGGHVEVVKYIISLETVDVNCRGWRKTTPVMCAGQNGHKDVVELLVNNGANLLLRNSRKNNILHTACHGGHIEVLKYVLSRNTVDINSRGNDNKTPVMVAGRRGHRDVVELLVDQRANLLLRDARSNNILHLGCQEGHVDVVKYVLSENVVDINSRGNNNKTPVMVAGRRGHKDVVELLVQNGAKLSLRDARGDNILHHVCSGGHVELLKYVLSQKTVDINSRGCDNMTPVMEAGQRGHKEVVGLLVKNGANLSLKADRSNNILHLACFRGHVEVVKYVLSQNAVDINSRGNSSKTPVMDAGRNGHKDMVELLVQNGANLSLSDAHGDNILHYVCSGGHVEVLKYVLSRDTEDINRRGNGNKTPVMVAGERGHRDVVELLVQKGANLSLRDARSDNILHLACRGGHVGVVEYILSQGIVDVNAKNEKRESAASIAKTLGLRHVLELLVSHGANM